VVRSLHFGISRPNIGNLVVGHTQRGSNVGIGQLLYLGWPYVWSELRRRRGSYDIPVAAARALTLRISGSATDHVEDEVQLTNRP